MHCLLRILVVLTFIVVPVNLVHAQVWDVSSGENPRGDKFASMHISSNEFGMEFYCDEHDWQDHRLGVKLLGPALPRLYGEDGDTAKLSLLFTLQGGVLYREAWDAYYFDGGLGDQAWLGSINAGPSELDALSAALKLEILNQDAESVYSFSTKGTAFGVRKIREVCDFERNEAVVEPSAKLSAKNTAQNTSVPADTSPTPKPTDQIRPSEAPNALTIEQFKVKVGWPESIAGYPISTPPSMKFAIIDAGFAGVEDYVADTTELHGRVRLYPLGDKPSQTEDHGLDVLKVVNEVMPDGQIYLIDVSNSTGDFAAKAIEKMNELGVHYGTMSVGITGRFGRHNFGKNVPRFVQLLEETQTTLFVSSGNYRHETHAVDFSDDDQNGFLEVWPRDADVASREALHVRTVKDVAGELVFAWDILPNVTGNVAIHLSDNAQFNQTHRFPVNGGTARVPVEAGGARELEIRIGVEDLNRPFGGIKVRRERLASTGLAWNGLNSSGDLAIWDSPFLITVGAAGELDGHLVPSYFSSIDTSHTGRTMPLVLGPGQITIGDEEHNGTSFSTPFLAALYAPFGSQNISNVIEHTSDFSAFGNGLVPDEMGRWGMPNAAKVLGSSHCSTEHNQLNNLQVSDAELTVDFQFSRNCMEKIRYAVVMGLETVGADPATGYAGAVTQTIDGVERALSASQTGQSEQRDIVDKKISFTLDLTNLSPRFKGAKVRPKFFIYTQLNQSGLVLYTPDEMVALP